MNKVRTIWNLSRAELLRLVRSTKIIILALFVIFANIQIVTPLRALSASMENKLSVFEPFVAVGNSGIVVLILPLFFLAMMADFPREGESQYFVQIRCSRRVWTAGQIVYAMESSAGLTIFVFAASALLSLDFISPGTAYSHAVTGYVAAFPERSGEYVVQLISENLYNQIPLFTAVIHTAFLLALYFLMLALLLLVFSLAKRKTAGIFLDGILILAGTATCAGRMAYMWVFPMAHTITWLNYTEYERYPVLSLFCSYLYFGIINTDLIVLAIVMTKHYISI